MIYTIGTRVQSRILEHQAFIPVVHSMQSEWYRLPGGHTMGKAKWLHKCMWPLGRCQVSVREMGVGPEVQCCICVTKVNGAVL